VTGRAHIYSVNGGLRLSRQPVEPIDTTTEAQAVQIAAYRRLGGAARLDILFRLTALACDTAMAGIRRRHPTYSDRQVQMAVRRLVLGDELVRQVWPDQKLVDP
jgi:hypothetical protein